MYIESFLSVLGWKRARVSRGKDGTSVENKGCFND